MASDVEIANRGLDKIGHSATPIVNISTDNTKQSKLVSRMYDFLRKKELSTNWWKFAKKRVALAPDVDAPAFGYTYKYELPVDFLRLYKVNTQYEYEIEGRQILCDDGPVLQIQYIADITDPNLFDPLYAEAFACLLAQELCEPITQSNTKRQFAVADYDKVIKQAKLMDAIQEPPIDLEDTSWLLERY